MNPILAHGLNAIGSLGRSLFSRSENTAAASDTSSGLVSLLRKAAVTQKNSTEETSSGYDDLDGEAFLTLLVTQLQYQDPMDPVDNSEMLAQLAQFSSLEQMTTLNENVELLAGNIDQLNFISATGLVGHNVTALDVDGNIVEGTVESVQLEGSVVQLYVDGQTVSMAGVLTIE